MKHLRVVSAVFVLTLGLFFVSCDSTNPPNDGSVLNLSPDTITFRKGDTSAPTTLGLSCGCAFTVAATSITGATTADSLARLQAVDPKVMSTLLAEHQIRFIDTSTRVNTAGSFTVALTATKKDYTYTRNVVVNITQ